LVIVATGLLHSTQKARRRAFASSILTG
jgi:hypothetical protein